MRRQLGLILLAGICGCAGVHGTARWQPCLGPGDIALAVPTFGMYNMICADIANARQHADWQVAEVERCVRQGGDPARCRCAVYGCNTWSVNVYR